MAGCVSPRKYSRRLVSCGRACKTSPCRTCFKPLAAAKKSRRARKVRSCGDPPTSGAPCPDFADMIKNQADRRLRPRARRRASTRRPPLVAIRARNPWRRLRTRLLGWKVRFTSPTPLPNQIGKMPDLVTSSGRFSQKCPQSQRMHDGKIAEIWLPNPLLA